MTKYSFEHRGEECRCFQCYIKKKPTRILWFEGISSYEILCQGSKGSPRGEARLYMTCNVEKVIVLNLWVSIMNWLKYTHDLAKVTVQQPSNLPLFAVSAFLANILMYKYKLVELYLVCLYFFIHLQVNIVLCTCMLRYFRPTYINCFWKVIWELAITAHEKKRVS